MVNAKALQHEKGLWDGHCVHGWLIRQFAGKTGKRLVRASPATGRQRYVSSRFHGFPPVGPVGSRRREPGRRLLQLVVEQFAEFGHFRRDHELTVRLAAISRLFLVVVLRLVELRQGHDLGDDRAVHSWLAAVPGSPFDCRLLGIRVERDRTVLLPTSLPWRFSVVGSWIVKNARRIVSRLTTADRT
jgi:hypothetical protein